MPPDAYVWIGIAVLFFASLGVFFCWRRKGLKKWMIVAALAVLAGWYVWLYGALVGIRQLEVRQVEYSSKDLPQAFDGYRIVQFCDAHVGSFNGWRKEILRNVIETINRQKADLIVFTGDLQNKEPQEIRAVESELRQLKAKDGVCSVLGNHDYAIYTRLDELSQELNVGRTGEAEMDMGWYLLRNGFHRIRRGKEQIIIAGMENDGEGHQPQKGRISSALYGLNRKDFVVMLEHDPTSWRRKILPHSHCQLTLSGHTHGGQIALMGHSLAQCRYRESAGMYYAGNRAMNVSTGIGGVVPVRFGVPPEIVVITLKRK